MLKENSGGNGEGIAYCDGDVTIHARDESSGILTEELIPGCSRDGRFDTVAGRRRLAGMTVTDGFDALEPRLSKIKNLVYLQGITYSAVLVKIWIPAFESFNERHAMRTQAMRGRSVSTTG